MSPHHDEINTSLVYVLLYGLVWDTVSSISNESHLVLFGLRSYVFEECLPAVFHCLSEIVPSVPRSRRVRSSIKYVECMERRIVRSCDIETVVDSRLCLFTSVGWNEDVFEERVSWGVGRVL